MTMKAKLLECAKVALGVALSIGGGIALGRYLGGPLWDRPAARWIHDTAHMPPDAIHGIQEDLPATCMLGQVYIAQDTNKAFACVTKWTEIPVTVIEDDRR